MFKSALRALHSDALGLVSSLTASAAGGAGPDPARRFSLGSRVLQEEGLIAEGGYAYVYLVKDVGSSGELLALKKMLCQDEDRLKLAMREVELLVSSVKY